MHGKVLAAGRHLQVHGVVALHALHVGRSHGAREERVFTVGFHAASPSRVAEDVDVRAPEGQSCVASVVSVAARHDILRAAFGGNGIADAFHQCRIERGSEADGLRKDRGPAVSAHAVQSFVPPVVRLYAEPWDARRLVHHLRNFLFERHLGDDVPRLLLKILGRRLRFGRHGGHEEQTDHCKKVLSHDYLRVFAIFCSISMMRC